MAQETVVLKLDASAQQLFERRIAAGAFEHRPVEHARFSVRGEGVVATLYHSGKLVVQGNDPGTFLARYVDGLDAVPTARRTELDALPQRTTIGSDETGKGDYFGPLVVAAVEVPMAALPELKKSGVVDSKLLSDDRIRVLAPFLCSRLRHAIERLDPVEYNRQHERLGNLNHVLADLHERAIRRLAVPGALVVVDRFGNERLLRERLASAEVELHQLVRGEQIPAVAAASVIARGAFLDALRELSEAFAIDLHKGAGPPVDRAARRFLQIHGSAKLREVAKLHFRNTGKLPQA